MPENTEPTQYDPKKVTVIIDGETATGFAEDSMIEVEKDEDMVSAHVGAQGEVTWVESANNLYTVTISLKHNSPTLKKLNNLALERKAFALSINDELGQDKFSGSQCRVRKPGNLTRGNEVEEIDVEIIVADGKLG